MTLYDFVQSIDLVEIPIYLVILMTLVQVAPIKVDPWTWLGKKIGKIINGEVIKKVEELEKNQKTAEKDALRTQLLLMIADYPEEKTEILKLSEHYFSNLHGNWTATAIFNSWLEKYNVARPEWFNTQIK